MTTIELGHSGPKSMARNNNIGVLKPTGPGEPHPYADGAELLCQRSKWRKNTGGSIIDSRAVVSARM